jgi:hypothetical protein
MRAMRSFSQALAALSLAAAVALVGCKSDAVKDTRADAAPHAAQPPPPASTDEQPPPAPPPPALGPKLQPLVDAVATDPVVSEDLRLLLDGLEWSELKEPFEKRLASETPPHIACAYARVHAAVAALKSEPHDSHIDGPLTDLDGALTDALAARNIDPAKTRSSCPDGG